MLAYNFSAVRGRKWEKDFYSFMCPLNILIKLLPNGDKSEQMTEEFPIDKNNIERLLSEIKHHDMNFTSDPVVVSINDMISFKTIDRRYQEIGILSFPMKCERKVISGNELKIAIDTLTESEVDLRESVIPVILFSDIGFSLTKDLYEKRFLELESKKSAINFAGEIEQIVHHMIIDHHWDIDKIDMKNRSLSKFTKKYFLEKEIIVSTKLLLRSIEGENDKELVNRFWEDYFDKCILLNKLTGYDLRQNYIFGYGTVLEAICIVANEKMSKNTYDADRFFEQINKVDWSRENNLWEGVIVSLNGRIIKNKKAVAFVVEILKKAR